MNYYFYLFIIIIYLTIKTYKKLCDKKILVNYIKIEDEKNIILFLKLITVSYFLKEKYLQKVLKYNDLGIQLFIYFLCVCILLVFILILIRSSKYIVYEFIPFIVLLFFSKDILNNIDFFHYHIYFLQIFKIFHYIIFFLILFFYYNFVNKKKIRYNYDFKSVLIILLIVMVI